MPDARFQISPGRPSELILHRQHTGEEEAEALEQAEARLTADHHFLTVFARRPGRLAVGLALDAVGVIQDLRIKALDETLREIRTLEHQAHLGVEGSRTPEEIQRDDEDRLA